MATSRENVPIVILEGKTYLIIGFFFFCIDSGILGVKKKHDLIICSPTKPELHKCLTSVGLTTTVLD